MKYEKPLYILPFDHRSSFYSKIFGFSLPLNKDQHELVSSYKNIVFEGFKKVRRDYKDKDHLGILVDEEFGGNVIKQAKKMKLNLAVSAEKSGQKVFQFEYGSKFKNHFKKIKPTFVKALVRYNPGNRKDNILQIKRLKQLNSFCKKEDIKLIIELLVPPTNSQEKKYTKLQFEKKIRPDLTVKSLLEFYMSGIDPDIWKLEPMESKKDWKNITSLINKEKYGTKIIVLGRGENKSKVFFWLKTAAAFPEIIGFAVGRTVFFNSLVQYKNKKLTKKETVDKIAKNYKQLIDLWNRSKR